METSKLPYKIEFKIETYDGDWTADDIDAGLAGTPRDVETETVVFDGQTPPPPQFLNLPDGPEALNTTESAIEGE